MDSRQKFVLAYAVISMIPFSVYTLLNVTDFGVYVITFVIIYFILRVVLNPRIRTSFDVVGFILLVFFVYFVAEHVITLLHP